MQRLVSPRGTADSPLTGKDVLLVRHCPYERWWLSLHSNILLGQLPPRPLSVPESLEIGLGDVLACVQLSTPSHRFETDEKRVTEWKLVVVKQRKTLVLCDQGLVLSHRLPPREIR